MESKKLLIVGIDPGITTAYAALDIEGNMVHLNSSKQLDLNHIISKIIDFGNVVLVGTDKAKVPRLVEVFATKLGARVVSPKYDLKVDEKRSMTSSFSFGDEHQGDALASALFAYKETKALLDKIDAFVKENKKHGIKDKIKELVITRKISIKNAAAIIEKKDEESIIVENVIEEKKLNESDFLRLYNKLKKYESEIKLIKKYNSSLRNKIIGLEKRQINHKLKVSTKKDDFRENRIRFLENLHKSADKKIEELTSLIKRYTNIISNINNFYILKKLDTLGINEFNYKNRILNVRRNDILLVDNPNIASNSIIELLKNKVFVIVYKKQVSKKVEESMPFVFMSSNKLEIDEYLHFGVVEKRHFEIEKEKVNWVKKVVEDYKKEREQLI